MLACDDDCSHEFSHGHRTSLYAFLQLAPNDTIQLGWDDRITVNFMEKNSAVVD